MKVRIQLFTTVDGMRSWWLGGSDNLSG